MTTNGAGSCYALVTADELDAGLMEARVARAAAGAVVLFRGVVRDHDHGREVLELEYVAHPTAVEVLEQVSAAFAAEPDVQAVAAAHRVGTLAVGDVAMVVAVACAHRGPAFDTCARLVDDIKARLPIWKRQVFVDGTDEWVDCP